MSYSFSVVASSKEAAIKAVAEQLQQVVERDAVHSADTKQALEAVSAYVGVLGEPQENDEVTVTVSGSVGWNGDKADRDFISAGISISASIRNA